MCVLGSRQGRGDGENGEALGSVFSGLLFPLVPGRDREELGASAESDRLISGVESSEKPFGQDIASLSPVSAHSCISRGRGQ